MPYQAVVASDLTWREVGEPQRVEEGEFINVIEHLGHGWLVGEYIDRAGFKRCRRFQDDDVNILPIWGEAIKENCHRDKDEVGLAEGAILQVTARRENGFLEALYRDRLGVERSGMFSPSAVRLFLEKRQSDALLAVAMRDHPAHEWYELGFSKGDPILITATSGSGGDYFSGRLVRPRREDRGEESPSKLFLRSAVRLSSKDFPLKVGAANVVRKSRDTSAPGAALVEPMSPVEVVDASGEGGYRYRTSKPVQSTCCAIL